MMREDLIERLRAYITQREKIRDGGITITECNGVPLTLTDLRKAAVALELNAPVGVEGLMQLARNWCLAWGEWAHDADPGCAKENAAEAALRAALTQALSQQPAACPKCGGTGEADSGGIMPWGAPAMIPCDCQQPAAVDEATQRDAERYRWLRDNAGAWEVSRDPGEWTKCGTGEKYKPRVYFTAFSTGYGGMFLDDAIDAAMAGANTKLREPNGSQEKQR